MKKLTREEHLWARAKLRQVLRFCAMCFAAEAAERERLSRELLQLYR